MNNNYLHLHFTGPNYFRATVSYIVSDNCVYIGWARCSDVDNYDKSVGRKIADQRIVECVAAHPDPMFTDMAGRVDFYGAFRLNLVKYLVVGPSGYEAWNRAIARSVAHNQRTYIIRQIERMNPNGYWYKP